MAKIYLQTAPKHVVIFFALFLPFSGAQGGDSVNNGGGLSESALMFSAKQFSSFLASCRRYDACGAREPYASLLAPLNACSLRGEGDIRFAVPQEAPALNNGTELGSPFHLTKEGFLLVNRLYLYLPRNESLRLPEAIGYFARIQLEICGGAPLLSSEDLGRHLARFADFEGERITVGKDDLHLPAKHWIRVRSFYSDLILESSDQLLRLACEGGDVRNCSLNRSDLQPSPIHFRNLGLVSEKLANGRLHFVVEGIFAGTVFTLEAEFERGKARLVLLDGRELELPKN